MKVKSKRKKNLVCWRFWGVEFGENELDKEWKVEIVSWGRGVRFKEEENEYVWGKGFFKGKRWKGDEDVWVRNLIEQKHI